MRLIRWLAFDEFGGSRISLRSVSEGNVIAEMSSSSLHEIRSSLRRPCWIIGGEVKWGMTLVEVESSVIRTSKRLGQCSKMSSATCGDISASMVKCVICDHGTDLLSWSGAKGLEDDMRRRLLHEVKGKSV